MGKRDYVMLDRACVLSLRIGDIKNLRYSYFDWGNKKFSNFQHKIHKLLVLPISDASDGQ